MGIYEGHGILPFSARLVLLTLPCQCPGADDPSYIPRAWFLQGESQV
jgi:hypothetical protein